MRRCVALLLALRGCWSEPTTTSIALAPPCTPGRYANGSLCRACEAGFYQPAAGAGAEAEEFYLQHPGNDYFNGVYRKGAGVVSGRPTYVSVANDICWWYVESDHNLWLAYSSCDGGLFGWASYTLAGPNGLLDAGRDLQYCKGCEAGSFSDSAGASACATCSTAYTRRLSSCPHTTVASTTRAPSTGTIAPPATIRASTTSFRATTGASSQLASTFPSMPASTGQFAISTLTAMATTNATSTRASATSTTGVNTTALFNATHTQVTSTTPQPTTTTIARTTAPTTTTMQQTNTTSEPTTTAETSATVMVSVVSMSFSASSLNLSLVNATQSTLSSTCADCSVDLMSVTYMTAVTYCDHGAEACVRQALGTGARRLLASQVQLAFVVISNSSYQPPAVVCAAPCTDYTLRANRLMQYNASLGMEGLALLLVIRDERDPLEINALAVVLVVAVLCLALFPSAWKIRRARKVSDAEYRPVQDTRDPVQDLKIDPSTIPHGIP